MFALSIAGCRSSSTLEPVDASKPATVEATKTATVEPSADVRTSSASSTTTAQTRGLRYEVTADERLDHLGVRVCFDGPRPRDLEPADKWVRRWLAGPILADPTRPDCLRYGVRLDDAARGEDDTERARRVGRDVVFSPDLFLWASEDRKDDTPVSVRFDLPPGLHASVPWPKREDGTYVVTRSTWCWLTSMALGRFDVERVDVNGGVLDVVRLDRPMRATPAGIRVWLERAAGAVAGLYGEMPVSRVQVIVVPVRGGDGVEFGMVQRGGGSTVIFFVSDSAEDRDLPPQWVGVHELSHLTLPFLVREDAWLSEGFATYYQNVLRARAGLMSERDAWQFMHDGFERGRRDAEGRKLSEVSTTMEREHHYMRVYWSGAAIALLADLELRRSSKGARSLDSAIASLKGCCLEPPAPRAREDERWTADEVLAALDEGAGSPTISEVAKRWLEAPGFPDVDAAYRALGLVVKDGKIELDDGAPLAAIRQAIAAPR